MTTEQIDAKWQQYLAWLDGKHPDMAKKIRSNRLAKMIFSAGCGDGYAEGLEEAGRMVRESK